MAGSAAGTGGTEIIHEPVGVDEALQAADRFRGTPILRTPLVRLRATHAPAEVHLKLENLQPIGSFKVRGMWNALAGAAERARLEGVWTLSVGNGAQGVAWSAQRLGVRCRVVAPAGASPAKLRAIEELGADILEVPRDAWFDYLATRSVPGVSGLLVHPFSDRAVMAGSATIAIEILEDLPDVEAVLVPWGGGGLCCGIASVLRELAPSVRVYACEFAPTAPLRASLDAGIPTVVADAHTFVDGIGAPRVYPEMLDLARRLGVASLVCPLHDVAAALRLVVERNAVVPEGAAAVPVAAAMSGAAGSGRVACVLSGGNIDPAVLASLLAVA